MVERLRFKRGFAEEENDYCAAEAVEHPAEYPAPTKEEVLYTFLVQYRELLQQTKQDFGLSSSFDKNDYFIYLETEQCRYVLVEDSQTNDRK